MTPSDGLAREEIEDAFDGAEKSVEQVARLLDERGLDKNTAPLVIMSDENKGAI